MDTEKTEKTRGKENRKSTRKLTNCFLERSLLVINFLVRIVTALSAMLMLLVVEGRRSEWSTTATKAKTGAKAVWRLRGLLRERRGL
jgi:hypothetical protein